MKIDWNSLEATTTDLTTLNKSGDQQVDYVIYSGLRVSLSKLNKLFTSSTVGSGLSIEVDTLVIDDPSFNATGISIIARCIDVSMLFANGQTASMILNPSSECFIVAGEILGGSCSFNTISQPTHIQTLSVGITPLKPMLMSVNSKGVLSSSTLSLAEALPNSLGRPSALNSLTASFVAASTLLEATDKDSVTMARSMLQWVIVTCDTIVTLNPNQEPSFEQLRIQAKALLITTMMSDNIYFAPPLVYDYYKEKISGLISGLSTYETQIQSLSTQTDIKQAIQDVSGTLQKNATYVNEAYQTQLQSIDENLKTLLQGINTLQSECYSQAVMMEQVLVELQAAMARENIKSYLLAVIGMATGAVKIVVAANPEEPNPGDIIEGVISVIQNGMTAIDEASKDVPADGNSLITAAKNLLSQQNEITITAWASYQLWLSAKGKPSVKLPAAAGVFAVDPRIAWQQFMILAEAELTNLKANNSAVADQVVNYLSSLKSFTQLAMGIDTNLVAYTAQMSEGITLTARINANLSITAEWQSLQKKSTTELEQLLALKGMIATQSHAIQRSIFASYRFYVSAYFYRNLKQPPETVNINMNSKELTYAFNSIASWTLDASNDKVILPVENASFPLKFKIVPKGEGHTGNVAYLTPADGDKTASLSFGFSMLQSSELAPYLGHAGKVAIWIKKAEVVFDGATPNDKNNIIFTLSCSGSYENGFGPDKSYSFVNGGVSGLYAYEANSKQAYIPWSIPNLVYSKPTPYTTWRIQMDKDGGNISSASAVTLNLTVALLFHSQDTKTTSINVNTQEELINARA